MDWGERRVGLALSDPSGMIATGLPTLHVRGKEDALAQVSESARVNEAERIVVGLPLLMSGERGEAARAAETFATALAERTGLPVETYDERLTSRLSQRRMHEVGARPRRSRGMVDQGAAVALLESYLTRSTAGGKSDG